MSWFRALGWGCPKYSTVGAWMWHVPRDLAQGVTTQPTNNTIRTSTPKLPLDVSVFCPWSASKTPKGKSYAQSLLSPCPPVLWYSIRKSRIKLDYQFKTIFQVVPWLPWVVLGGKSLPADKIFEFVVLSLAIRNVFNFPFFFTNYLNMLGFWLLSFPDWVRLVLRQYRDMKHWVNTFHREFQCQFAHGHWYLLTNRKGCQPSIIQCAAWLCYWDVLADLSSQTLLPMFHYGVSLTPLSNWLLIESCASSHSVGLDWTSWICFGCALTVWIHCLDVGILLYVGFYL